MLITHYICSLVKVAGKFNVGLVIHSVIRRAFKVVTQRSW